MQFVRHNISQGKRILPINAAMLRFLMFCDDYITCKLNAVKYFIFFN